MGKPSARIPPRHRGDAAFAARRGIPFTPLIEMTAEPRNHTRIHSGTPAVLESVAEGGHFGVAFEDDGDTGYFYGSQVHDNEPTILDALHIYDAGRDMERDQVIRVEIRWSSDLSRSALLIDGRVQAAFDFAHRRAVCRSDFPPADGSFTSTHRWDDSVVDWLH